MINSLPKLHARLLELRDPQYAKFQRRLLPTVPPDRVLGVRTPDIRRLAKEINGTSVACEFLASLPHAYYDENNLHAALLELETNFELALSAVERFLPHIDNWATCDGYCPKCLYRQPERLWQAITAWLCSDRVYTVRFALVRLTAGFLRAPLFSTAVLDAAAAVTGEDYYIKMAQAWLFSMALVKQFSATLPYLTEARLGVWVHNKAIQKAIESLQTDPARKAYLKTLKRKERTT